MKIRLEIRRKICGDVTGQPIIKDYDTNEKKISRAKEKAKLDFLNEYINRDCFIANYDSVSLAMKQVNLQIKAYQIT